MKVNRIIKEIIKKPWEFGNKWKCNELSDRDKVIGCITFSIFSLLSCILIFPTVQGIRYLIKKRISRKQMKNKTDEKTVSFAQLHYNEFKPISEYRTFEDVIKGIQNGMTAQRLEKILDLYPDLAKSSKDKNGRTLLHFVIEENYKELVQVLIDKGADVNVYDTVRTPLHSSCYNEKDDPSIAEILLKNGAMINAVTKETKFTPLHLAVYFSNFEIMKFLIGKGADKAAKNVDGFTPLNFATKLMHPEHVVNALKLTNSKLT